MSESASDERELARDRYETVLRVVGHNTTPSQSPGARRQHILQVCTRKFDVDGVKHAIQAALEQGDLFRWRDYEGRWRYTVVTAEYKPRRDPEQMLLRVIEHLREAENVDHEQIGRVNAALKEVRDGGD